MANAVEEALNRANAEQRAKAQQVIEEARQNISPSDANNAAPPLPALCIWPVACLLVEVY